MNAPTFKMEPGVAYMAVPRCGSCHWWLPVKGLKRGTCLFAEKYSGMGEDMPSDGFMAEGEIPPQEVVSTGPDFGCIHWTEDQ